MWAETPYKIDGSVSLLVYKDDQQVGTYREVHSFNIKEGGVLYIVTKSGRSVDAWAAGAWDYFEAGEDLD